MMADYNAKGIAIAMFDKIDILYDHYFGVKDERKTSPDIDTIFGIASITKSFTVLGILKLHQQGIININNPIETYIPEIQFSDKRKPTLIHLLSHTVGYYPQKRLLIKDFAKALGIPYSDELSTNTKIEIAGFKAMLSALNENLDYTGEPGEYTSYSNDSYGILTEIIRRYGNKPCYCDYITDEIIKPLGLEHTFFEFKKTKTAKNITTLYTSKDDKQIHTQDYQDLGFVLMGGGGLKSTLGDLIKYTQFYLSFGGDLIESNLIKEMMVPRAGYKPQQYYGLGLVTGHLDDIKYAGHSGGLTGVSSFFGFSHDLNKGVVVLCNTSGVPVTSIGLSALRLLNDKEAKPSSILYRDIQWSSDLIQKTVGEYFTAEDDSIQLIYKDHELMLYSGNNSFRLRTVQDSLILMLNKQEQNTIRILRDNNQNSWALYFGSRIMKKK